MKNAIKSRKGATLIELLIVLAVLVIAAGMVVTFTSMMHGAQGISNARHEALQDVIVAESLIEGFIENNSSETLKIQENASGAKGDALYVGNDFATKTGGVFLSYAGAFVVSGNEVLFLESLDSITFEEHGTADKIYYCTIKYNVAGTPCIYTFCVNPYVGEGVN